MPTCAACGIATPPGARFCSSCGRAFDDRPPTDERKLATVLFAELVGSTALANDADPERVRARLERVYEAMSEEIELAGGAVEKFAGDAVMAAFGAPPSWARPASSRPASCESCGVCWASCHASRSGAPDVACLTGAASRTGHSARCFANS
jgi:class 3 adenylate cyclase